MSRLKLPLILQSLVFLIPISYFVNGKGTATGIQWALFQYQQDIFGNYLSSILYRSFAIIAGGPLSPRGTAALLWDCGAILLIVAFIIQLLVILEFTSASRKWSAIITAMAGFLFLLSGVVQYGLVLSGPNGLSIPLGIPVLFVIGWLIYRYEDPGEMQEPGLAGSARCGISDDLILIVFVSIIVKIIVFSISMYATVLWGSLDINLYHQYLNSVLSGQIPYIDFTVEYPQLFFVPVIIAAVPSLVLQDPSVYLPSFMVLMNLIDTCILIMVYFIGLRLFGQEKALLCSMLYATAFSSAFLVSITYDSFPTFFLVLSILLFLYGKEIPAYVSATIGALSKWFPIFCFPYYVLYSVKNRKNHDQLKNGLIISAVIVCLGIIPFIIINYPAFFRTYLFHVGREAYYRSMIYYLDSITQFFFNYQPFVDLSLVILAVFEIALLYWYYKYLDGKEITLCYVIFLSIFCFILVNKVFGPYYTIWIVPFLALFMIHSFRHVVLFYILQLVMYLESPVLLELGIREYSFAGPSFIVNAGIFHPFVFYSVKFLIFFIILCVIIRDAGRIPYPGPSER
jgi:hypothetical protein